MAEFNIDGALRITSVDVSKAIPVLQQKLSGINLPNLGIGKQPAADFAALSNSVQDAARQIGGYTQTLGSLKGQIDKAKSSADQLNAATKAPLSNIQDFADKAGLALRRFTAFTISTVAVFGTFRAISSGTKAALDFERQMIRVAQVTGTLPGQLNSVRKAITDTSSAFGASSAELADVAQTLAQAGFSLREVEDAVKSIGKFSLTPTFTSAKDTAEALIALQGQFKISSRDFADSLNIINTVSGKFAVETPDLLRVIQKTGGVFANASRQVSGGKESLSELLALFTSVRASTRQSADQVATGLSTIFARLQRPELIDFFNSLGVSITDASGKLKGPLDQIRAISQAFNQLEPGDVRIGVLTEELGGIRQFRNVIPLLTNIATAEKVLTDVRRSGDSVTKDSILAQTNLSVAFQQTQEKFLAMVREFTASDTFQTLARSALVLADSIIAIGTSMKEVIPLLTLFGAIKIGASFLGGGGIGSFLRGFGGNRVNRNTGGPIPGVGSSDTVPAMLTPGEFVINKKSAEKLGPGFLNALNRGSIKGFQTGGFVPNSPSVPSNRLTTNPQFNLDASLFKELAQSLGIVEREINKVVTAASKTRSLSGARQIFDDTISARKTSNQKNSITGFLGGFFGGAFKQSARNPLAGTVTTGSGKQIDTVLSDFLVDLEAAKVGVRAVGFAKGGNSLGVKTGLDNGNLRGLGNVFNTIRHEGVHLARQLKLLTDADIEGLAKDLGLDFDKDKKVFGATQAEENVAKAIQNGLGFDRVPLREGASKRSQSLASKLRSGALFREGIPKRKIDTTPDIIEAGIIDNEFIPQVDEVSGSRSSIRSENLARSRQRKSSLSSRLGISSFFGQKPKRTRRIRQTPQRNRETLDSDINEVFGFTDDGGLPPNIPPTSKTTFPFPDDFNNRKKTGLFSRVKTGFGSVKNTLGTGGAGLGLALAGNLIGSSLSEKSPGLGGAISGASNGALTGAALGSFIPGVGTVAGGVIGGAIGGATGFLDGQTQQKRIAIEKKLEQSSNRLGNSLAELGKNMEKTGKIAQGDLTKVLSNLGSNNKFKQNLTSLQNKNTVDSFFGGGEDLQKRREAGENSLQTITGNTKAIFGFTQNTQDVRNERIKLIDEGRRNTFAADNREVSEVSRSFLEQEVADGSIKRGRRLNASQENIVRSSVSDDVGVLNRVAEGTKFVEGPAKEAIAQQLLLNEGMAKLRNETIANAEANKKLQLGQSAFQASLIKLSDAAERASAVLANFDQDLDARSQIIDNVIASASGGIGAATGINANPFSNIKGASGKDIDAGISRIESLTGVTIGQDQKDLLRANDSLRNIPQIIRDAVDKAPLSKDGGDENVRTKLRGELTSNGQLAGLPLSFRNTITNNLREKSSSKLVDQNRSDPQSLINDLLGGAIDPNNKAFADILDRVNVQQDFLKKQSVNRTGLLQQKQGLFLQGQSSVAANRDFLESADGVRIDSQTAINRDLDSVAGLTDGTRINGRRLGGTDDPTGIGNRIAALQSRRSELENGPQTLESTKELSKVYSDIQSNTQALNKLSSGVSGLAKIQEELARIEANRQTAQNATLDLALASPEQAQQIVKGNQAFQAFQQGGVGGALSQGFTRDDIKAGLDRAQSFAQSDQERDFIRTQAVRTVRDFDGVGVAQDELSKRGAFRLQGRSEAAFAQKELATGEAERQQGAILEQAKLVEAAGIEFDKQVRGAFESSTALLREALGQFPSSIEMKVQHSDINVNIAGGKLPLEELGQGIKANLVKEITDFIRRTMPNTEGQPR